MSQTAHSPAILKRTGANIPLHEGREAIVRDAAVHTRPAPGQTRPRLARDNRTVLSILAFGLAAIAWIALLGDIRAGLVGLDAPPTWRATGPNAERPGGPSPGGHAQVPADARD